LAHISLEADWAGLKIVMVGLYKYITLQRASVCKERFILIDSYQADKMIGILIKKNEMFLKYILAIYIYV
jgi:hypothetical protein